MLRNPTYRISLIKHYLQQQFEGDYYSNAAQNNF